MTYIYHRPQWPKFTWDAERLADLMARVSRRQGLLVGRMSAQGFALRMEANLATLTEDVVKSSAIEGEVLDREQVRSSLARRLGVDTGGLPPVDRHVEGVVQMLLDATRNYAAPLTATRLFSWHAALFPTGWSGLNRIVVGAWRDGPMQVVSGSYGQETVHFEAPAAQDLDAEMSAFLTWFENGRPIDPVIKAALAHLWFVTVHPFEDGNGRIARAIADLALARAEGTDQRFYSMSSQIQAERKAYYAMLEAAQKGGVDVTEWLEWFLHTLERAIQSAAEILDDVLAKGHFWEAHADRTFNARQRKMIDRLLQGFEGKLTNAKWAAITKSSADTALRDINDLVAQGVLKKDEGGGRSTSYSLVEPDRPLRV